MHIFLAVAISSLIWQQICFYDYYITNIMQMFTNCLIETGMKFMAELIDRTEERLFANQKVYIVHSDLMYTATLVHCSQKGIYVKSEISFPIDTALRIVIPLKDERWNIAARVVRSVKRNGYYLLLQDV